MKKAKPIVACGIAFALIAEILPVRASAAGFDFGDIMIQNPETVPIVRHSTIFEAIKHLDLFKTGLSTPENSYRLITYILVSTIAVLIYWDATRNKIGRVAEAKGLLNMRAGEWAFAAQCLFLFLAPISWVLYLVNRKNLIAKAQKNPVDLTMRHRIFVVFLIAFLPIIWGLLLRLWA